MEQYSSVNGSTDIPLIEATIGQFFDEASGSYADIEALVSCHQRVRLTYAELRRKVDAVACSLLRLGLTRGDRVAIWSQNDEEWTLTQFATAKCGLILVNINPAYRLSELEYAINKVSCKAIILSPSFKSSDYLQMLNELAPEIIVSVPGHLNSERLPSLGWIVRLGAEKTPGMLNFADLLDSPTDTERASLGELGATLKATDPISIQFTSGTTGLPKGATLTHRNILNNGRFVGDAIRLETGERLCIPVPLYHRFGMVMGNLGCLTHGATMVYLIGVLDHPDFESFEVTSLRTGIMAGSPCPIEVMKRVVDKLHMGQVTIAYGMTETSPPSFQSSIDDPIERRVSTVGRVLPHCEVKVVDAEGNTVPRGVSGELCTRGYLVMHGYWADQVKTDEAVDGQGWMHTGDLGVIDDEGYCKIGGRIKDMVIRGGENVYPREVEEFLFRHPQIRDVQVVGVPDKKYGEEICAWVIVREYADLTADDVGAFCQGQIGHYKIPRYVKFVENFPTTVTEKIQKFRDQMIEELGLEVSKTA